MPAPHRRSATRSTITASRRLQVSQHTTATTAIGVRVDAAPVSPTNLTKGKQFWGSSPWMRPEKYHTGLRIVCRPAASVTVTDSGADAHAWPGHACPASPLSQAIPCTQHTHHGPNTCPTHGTQHAPPLSHPLPAHRHPDATCPQTPHHSTRKLHSPATDSQMHGTAFIPSRSRTYSRADRGGRGTWPPSRPSRRSRSSTCGRS